MPLGMANRFELVVHAPGEINLGSWTKVAGLDVSWDVAEYRAGDAKNERWYQPGNTKYSEVTFGRAACKDSKTVQGWLEKQSFGFKGSYTADIILKDSSNTEVLKWEVRDFMVKKWSVDGFDAGKSSIAIETLQFTHMGFLENE
jgi:phage tail-like protein